MKRLITFLLLLLLFFLSEGLFCQIELHVPNQIQITVNDSALAADKAWQDKLCDSLPARPFMHSICGFHANGSQVNTKIRLPQFLNRKQVAENIVLYYCMFDDDGKRRNERLLVYPYFTDLTEKPFVTCRYLGDGHFLIHFRQWETISKLKDPALPEKEIYNLILQEAFSKSENMDSIPDEIIQSVAAQNNLDPLDVRRIYEFVFLWQLNSQNR